VYVTGDCAVITAWRHNSPAWRLSPDVSLGTLTVYGPPSDVARRLRSAGARLVELDEPVELDAAGGQAHSLWMLSLVRELTARAIDVSWALGADFLTGADWRDFSHLMPPREISGADPRVLTAWRHRHYIGRCMYRRGPGFIQIRDRRRDELRGFVLDQPDYLDAVDALEDPAADRPIPRHVQDAFVEERLLVPVGDSRWWAPYRLRRWPLPCWDV
jgi:hypothetical protein